MDKVSGMGLLDSMDRIQQLDGSGMLRIVDRSAELMEEALQAGRSLHLPFEGQSIRNIVACGLGGSAIGFDLLKAFLGSDLDLPFLISRNYSVPNFVNRSTLVLVSSYSGETEETLSAFQEARERKAEVVCMASGGELAREASRNGLPLLSLPGGLPPRTAMGYSFITALSVFSRLGWIGNRSGEVEAAVRGMKQRILVYQAGVPASDNPAKQLALNLQGKVVAIYGSQDRLDVVARRWATQLAENAKQLAYWNSLPEMTHNEIVGWRHPEAPLKEIATVVLTDRDDHERIRFRARWLSSRLRESAAYTAEIQSDGGRWLDRLWGLVLLGDYSSVYLALLNQENPTPVHAIEVLKNDLRDH